MDFRALVTGESDIAYLAGLSRLEHRFNRAARSENQLGVGVANDFAKLNQIDSIGLQPAERVVQLLGGGRGVAPVRDLPVASRATSTPAEMVPLLWRDVGEDEVTIRAENTKTKRSRTMLAFRNAVTVAIWLLANGHSRMFNGQRY